MSAFFIVPAIFEMKLTNVGKIISGEFNFSDHFVFWDQLWNSAWGFAGSAKGRMDGMSFKIGKLHLIFALSGLIFVLARKRSKWFLDQNPLSTSRVDNFGKSVLSYALKSGNNDLISNIISYAKTIQKGQ